MNRPKATPSLVASLTPQSVVAGCQRLPGDWGLDNPSITIQVMIKTVDSMPRMEANDKRERGMNIVGIILKCHA